MLKKFADGALYTREASLVRRKEPLAYSS